MDPALAKAREVAAAEDTARSIAAVAARLDAIEAKIDQMLAAAEPSAAVHAAHAAKKPGHGS